MDGDRSTDISSATSRFWLACSAPFLLMASPTGIYFAYTVSGSLRRGERWNPTSITAASAIGSIPAAPGRTREAMSNLPMTAMSHAW